jgi:2-oxoglutarate decarboxylase
MITPNSAFVDELYFSYLRDKDSVPIEWRAYFETQQFSPETTSSAPIQTTVTEIVPPSNGTTTNGKAPELKIAVIEEPVPAPSTASPTTVAGLPHLGPNDEAVAMSNLSGKIAENMQTSLTVPTATSIRTMPVKVLEENRRIINKFLVARRKKKISFTHLIGWAIVQAVKKYPSLNDTYSQVDGKHYRIKRGSINLGLAVDMTRKDGTRMLMVPSIKNAQSMNFAAFCTEYDRLIAAARNNKLTPDDLSGATVTLTNPGTIGTLSSIPRLMSGQGLIVASGSIDYPPEFHGVLPGVLSTMAISKVVTLTSTYDHRIIQGAESGEFLSNMHKMMLGNDRFYDTIFATLHIPFEPSMWSVDNQVNPFGPLNEMDSIEKEGKVVQMIATYRDRGHLAADINPLGYQSFYFSELNLSYYGFTLWDLDREFDTGGLAGKQHQTLREIADTLWDTYCGKIGIEFSHNQDPEKTKWIINKLEVDYKKLSFSTEEKKHIYTMLSKAETFENFLHTRFLGNKRFSIEGGESMLVLLDGLLENAALDKTHSTVIGMAHRGRLNVLANIMGKPLEKIFDEFEGVLDPNSYQGSGDVKYHLGSEGIYTSRKQYTLPVTLSPNPSHLEAVDPVVVGMARGIADSIGDKTSSKVLPVLIHGDAAFAGQGVVTETLNFAELEGYTTGGTIHIIINNQIGFTTNPIDSRSTTYATGVAKMLQVPILHVNGDDPEAVRKAALFAYEYRTQFNDDVIIDMYCYRKYGHNEGDEPTYTQPLLYKKIKNHTPARSLYKEQLIDEKVLTSEEADEIHSRITRSLNDAFSRESKVPSVKAPTIEKNVFAPVHTAVAEHQLKHITSVISTIPEGFKPHPKLQTLITKRGSILDNDKPSIDWAIGEALAIGSLLLEKAPIRLCGQDVRRGTFSHRHATLTDFETENEIVLLNMIDPNQEHFYIYDSPLSEYAAMGFEFGYSVVRPNGLTIWEAQFGDFVNGAQIILDQFLSSSEAKWNQTSNLTLLLPHGFEGQGPEHSSARLERFLQNCAEDNMTVCNLTTPAQYFHALRRQVVRKFNMPLIIMSPKSLLRQPISVLSELTSGSFMEIIDDTTVSKPEAITRVLLCSGKIYYELLNEKKRLNADDVAIVRMEQIYPFHEELMKSILERYPVATEIFHVQEEPKNQGSWFFIQPRVSSLLKIQQKLSYVGRKESASPATGSSKKHEVEQRAIIDQAFAKG